MKIVAVADLHGYLPSIEPCDLLILAGDICPNFAGTPDKDRFRQAAWMDRMLRPWLQAVPAKTVLAIWGNHDWVGQRSGLVPDGLRWTLINDRAITIDGLRIYGTPWTPTFFNWAFMKEEEALEAYWDAIPNALDILVSHGPPYGYRDRVSPTDVRCCGSKALLTHVTRSNPALVICGHIHGGRGEAILPVGGTIKNVAFVDEAYKPRQVPSAFEYNRPDEARDRADADVEAR